MTVCTVRFCAEGPNPKICDSMRIPLQKFESARHGLLEEADEAANHRYRHIDDPRSTNFGLYFW
jgi:hypothetical protein